MRLRWRTIRQRRERARKAQVAAVATTLALLLVVTYLSNYLVYTLPGQMGEVEFEHLVQVENQLARLQATILAQATEAVNPITIENPITLGSTGQPPFGPPAAGYVGPDPGNISVGGTYQLNTVSPAEPNWGSYSACLPGGAGTCASTGAVDYANFSGNGTTRTILISGTSNSLVYNVNGNNDTLTFTWSGKNAGVAEIVINGSYDKVTFSKTTSDTTVPTSNFYFFGQHDKYSMALAGSHATSAGMFVNVNFIGSLGLLCPYGNNSASDAVGTLGVGGTYLNLSVTWWNADGYTTAPYTVAYPGSSLPSESVTWQNNTGSVACPFLQVSTTQYPYNMTGGIGVHLANLYQPSDDLSYEDGAVVLSNPGELSVMLNGPDFTYAVTPSGLHADLTFFQITGTLPTESGVSTAGVGTRIASISTSTFGGGVNGLFLGDPYYVNVTTLFPAAWVNYFDGQPAYPNGATCIVPNPPLPGGYSCLEPPPLTPMVVSAPLYAQSITVTLVAVVAQIY